MHYHSNHCWCNNSHWNDESYMARHMVDVEKHLGYDTDDVEDDWINLVDEVRVVDEKRLEINRKVWAEMAQKYPDKEMNVDEKQLRVMSMTDAPTLKDDVLLWLEANVADAKDSYENGTTKGWCMGNQAYRSRGEYGRLTLWFQRKKDAMAFIKAWSVHEKPTTYFDYFKEIRKKLVDGKLVLDER